MDFKIKYETPCACCGAMTLTITGCCAACHLSGAVSFWNFMAGKIDLTSHLANLRPFGSPTEPVFPVAGDAVSCGLRSDVPKKMRRHLMASLGMDTRSLGDKGFWDVEVFACVRCGRDSKGSSSDVNAVDRMG